MKHFVIREKLPSLNDVIARNRGNKYVGAKMKRDVQDKIDWYIKQAVTKGDLTPISSCCTISITWHEKTRKRDADNIQSAQKFILDSMVEMGILTDDSRKFVSQIYHQIVDDNENYVEVYINDTI